MRRQPWKMPSALRLEHPEAQIIAGGTDVLVQMREGKRAGKELISIQRCDEMRGVTHRRRRRTSASARLTSFSHITHDPIIQQYINVLGEAVDMVGGPQIRNAGTIGGNTCNGVTSADSASTLHAWEAIVELTGKNGVRRLSRSRTSTSRPAPSTCASRTARSRRPSSSPRHPMTEHFGHYIKYAMRNAMDIATTRLLRQRPPERGQKDVRPRAHRLRRGGSRPDARASSAEGFMQRQACDAGEHRARSAATVLEDIHPRDSWRASKAFREPHRRGDGAKRCLIESVKLAGGEL